MFMPSPKYLSDIQSKKLSKKSQDGDDGAFYGTEKDRLSYSRFHLWERSFRVFAQGRAQSVLYDIEVCLPRKTVDWKMLEVIGLYSFHKAEAEFSHKTSTSRKGKKVPTSSHYSFPPSSHNIKSFHLLKSTQKLPPIIVSIQPSLEQF